jgi:hypothetical protein
VVEEEVLTPVAPVIDNNLNQNEMSKLADLLHKVDAEFIQGIAYAEKTTSAILQWLKSPQAQTIESVLAGVLPASSAWLPEAITIATALAIDMKALSNPISQKGIAVRLGAEILAIIHGKKLPTGIDGYLLEFQKIFVG